METSAPRDHLDACGDEGSSRPFRTCEFPSEIVWTVVHAASSPDDAPDLREGFPAYVLALRVADHLGIHDNTTAVSDLVPLATWAVLNGAPAELVTFVKDAS